MPRIHGYNSDQLKRLRIIFRSLVIDHKHYYNEIDGEQLANNLGYLINYLMDEANQHGPFKRIDFFFILNKMEPDEEKWQLVLRWRDEDIFEGNIVASKADAMKGMLEAAVEAVAPWLAGEATLY